MIVIMLGAPGTGKGTIGELMSQYYDIPHISIGDVLRDEIKNNPNSSDMIKESMSTGKLLPGEIIYEIVERRIKKMDCQNGMILDGYPRTLEQASDFYNMLKKQKRTLTAAINLETPKDEIIERIVNRRVCPKCKAIYNIKTSKPITEGICDKCDTKLITRLDDTEEIILNRLKQYEEKSKPLINYYEKTGKLFSVVVSDRAGKLGKTVLKEIVWYIEKG